MKFSRPKRTIAAEHERGAWKEIPQFQELGLFTAPEVSFKKKWSFLESGQEMIVLAHSASLDLLLPSR